MTADAFRRFVHTHATVDDAPIAVALTGAVRVVVTGPPPAARALVRSMVCQLAVSHSPDAILIGAVVGSGAREHWDWLKWLPHNTIHPAEPDGLTTRRADRCRACRRHVVLVVDGSDPDCPWPARARPSSSSGTDAADTMRFALISTVPAGWSVAARRFARADGMTLSRRRESAPAVWLATVPPIRCTDDAACRGLARGGVREPPRERCGFRWALGRRGRTRSTSTSRKRPKEGTAHTGCASARPARASRSCCAPSSWA